MQAFSTVPFASAKMAGTVVRQLQRECILCNDNSRPMQDNRCFSKNGKYCLIRKHGWIILDSKVGAVLRSVASHRGFRVHYRIGRQKHFIYILRKLLSYVKVNQFCLLEHVFPENPVAQEHWKSSFLFTHVAPFWQGLPLQASEKI